MKKITLLFLLAFLQNAFCQQNLNFEDWTHNTTPSYDKPNGWWTSLNGIAQYGAPITVVKDSDAQNGSYAVKATSKNWQPPIGQGVFIPGMVAIGVLDLNIQNVRPSAPFPFSAPIDGIGGFYKYTPANGDSCVFYMNLTKWNGTKRDTIAEGTVYDKNTSTSYKQFYLQLKYKQTGILPDSIYFIAAASGGQLGKVGQDGSTLYVDNLVFSTNVKNEKEISEFPVRIYPNPATSKVLFSLPSDVDYFKIEIFDLEGRKFFEKEFNDNNVSINVENFNSGLHVVKITDKFNHYSLQKLSIQN